MTTVFVGFFTPIKVIFFLFRWILKKSDKKTTCERLCEKRPINFPYALFWLKTSICVHMRNLGKKKELGHLQIKSS